MECPLCTCGTSEHDEVWHAYAQNMKLADAHRMAQRRLDDPSITSEQVDEHLRRHHWVQPSPPGKLHPSLALQEALVEFKRHEFYLLRALYRAKALSARQIYALFYLDHAVDGPDLQQRLADDLHRLTFRSFLYQHWPENRGALTFDDPGPYYCLNRQAIPIINRLEDTSVAFNSYTTSIAQIQEFNLEHDCRFHDVIVALRQSLYRRSFSLAGREVQAHVGVEHWYAPVQLNTHLKLLDGQEVNFTPAGLLGVRLESRDSDLSTLLPLWLEYDRGTHDADLVAQSVLCYGNYFNSPDFKKRFPRLAEHKSTGPLVVICESAYRRDEVAQALEARLGGKRVPVYLTDRPTVSHDPYTPGILTTPGGGDERFTLLDRLVEHSRTLIQHRVYVGTDRLTDPSVSEVLARRAKSSGGQADDPAKKAAKAKPDNTFDLSGFG